MVNLLKYTCTLNHVFDTNDLYRYVLQRANPHEKFALTHVAHAHKNLGCV